MPNTSLIAECTVFMWQIPKHTVIKMIHVSLKNEKTCHTFAYGNAAYLKPNNSDMFT